MRLSIMLVGLWFVNFTGLGTHVAAKKPKAKRKGDEGRSGQRCVICQRLAHEAMLVWNVAKTTKPGSPYNYIGAGSQGQAAEEKVLETLKRKICNKNLLAALPNPNGYALHHPTLQYECEDILETNGEGMVDALTLNEDMGKYCFDIDICGSNDKIHYDFVPEDFDDEEDTSVKKKKNKKNGDL
mmetsp:Transcript_103519/g.183905  ORF Transcript_103519/g.183905 Transcript_103519/m.183905 type:complete len:184 (+) Transcript_103519:66-617(+)